MDKIIEIKRKRIIIFGLPILYIITFFGLIFYSYKPSEELSLFVYLIIILLPLFLIVSSIDDYFVRITLTENAIIKKSFFINKVIELDEIKEAWVLKHNNSIIINTKNKRLGVGWEYEEHQKFKELLIKELEKRQIPIIYKNYWC